MSSVHFFFKDTAPTETYPYLHTLSLHDALPICVCNLLFEDLAIVPIIFALGAMAPNAQEAGWSGLAETMVKGGLTVVAMFRSEEHTSELQSLMRISYAVFCLKKKKYTTSYNTTTSITN